MKKLGSRALGRYFSLAGIASGPSVSVAQRLDTMATCRIARHPRQKLVEVTADKEMLATAGLIYMDICENIQNAECLISVFGRWPSFHDAEVIWLRLDRRASSLGKGPTLETLIHTWEMTSEVNAAGYYILRNHLLVHLRFSRVEECILDGFNYQNVLNCLHIEEIRNRQMGYLNFQVRLDTSHGLEALFQCQEIEVVEIQPCSDDGTPLPGSPLV